MHSHTTKFPTGCQPGLPESKEKLKSFLASLMCEKRQANRFKSSEKRTGVADEDKKVTETK